MSVALLPPYAAFARMYPHIRFVNQVLPQPPKECDFGRIGL
jgi:hypothetical protein